jgi:UDP-N-acetylglucosamine diphosphorylase/glucosamine-1-phosphate N-acetyltransferase
MSIILFDDETLENLKPLTLNKSVSDLRIGIFTIEEKWNKYLNDIEVTINSSFLPDEKLVQQIKDLKADEALYFNDVLIAFKSNLFSKRIQVVEVCKINHLWDLFLLNASEIKKDILLIKEESKNIKIGQAVVLNEEDGPIYVGNNVTIMDGALLRGPIALCDGAVVKMGAKIYGGTTIGVKCTVGGEIKNSILQGYSNKAHDGYLGNSVIGEWCNLGADTNCSNMKNTMGEIKVWNYKVKDFINSGQQFCGVFMGDYTKTAISTKLNSGTSIGLACNIFQTDFSAKYVPSFSWGDEKFELEGLHRMNERMKELKGEEYSVQERQIVEGLNNLLINGN